MNELSLKNRELDRLTGRLVLIHGREDTMIPFTESMDLADAVPKTELFLIDGFSHIDPSTVGAVGKIQLVRAVQAILERRYPIEAN
jgi:pimeloyl-ACP methyl ester carboxylesterase